MANINRGEVSLEVEGKVWTFVFDFNTFCDLEDRIGKNINEIDLDAPGARLTRDLVWVGLKRHHPDLSTEEAGRLVTVVGPARMTATITEAIKAAFPSQEQTAGEAKAATKAQRRR